MKAADNPQLTPITRNSISTIKPCTVNTGAYQAPRGNRKEDDLEGKSGEDSGTLIEPSLSPLARKRLDRGLQSEDQSLHWSLDQRDDAIAWLERGYEQRDPE